MKKINQPDNFDKTKMNAFSYGKDRLSNEIVNVIGIHTMYKFPFDSH